MAATYSREAQDAIQALDRLVHRHKLLSLDQGKSAARIITGDENVEFPPPRPPPPVPAAPPAAPIPPPAPPPAPEDAAAPMSGAPGAPPESPTEPAGDGSSPAE